MILQDSLFSKTAQVYWTTVSPTTVEATCAAPLKSGEEMYVTNGTSIELTSLKQQLLAPFQGHPVSDTFWSTLSSHVIRAIAGPLFSYQSISKSGEANARAYLIEPVIRELTQHLSNLPSPPPECSHFNASINMEQSIRRSAATSTDTGES